MVPSLAQKHNIMDEQAVMHDLPVCMHTCTMSCIIFLNTMWHASSFSLINCMNLLGSWQESELHSKPNYYLVSQCLMCQHIFQWVSGLIMIHAAQVLAVIKKQQLIHDSSRLSVIIMDGALTHSLNMSVIIAAKLY